MTLPSLELPWVKTMNPSVLNLNIKKKTVQSWMMQKTEMDARFLIKKITICSSFFRFTVRAHLNCCFLKKNLKFNRKQYIEIRLVYTKHESMLIDMTQPLFPNSLLLALH